MCKLSKARCHYKCLLLQHGLQRVTEQMFRLAYRIEDFLLLLGWQGGVQRKNLDGSNLQASSLRALKLLCRCNKHNRAATLEVIML